MWHFYLKESLNDSEGDQHVEVDLRKWRSGEGEERRGKDPEDEDSGTSPPGGEPPSEDLGENIAVEKWAEGETYLLRVPVEVPHLKQRKNHLTDLLYSV